MPNPDEGRFQLLTPKGPPVQVGEKLEIRLTPEAELLFRLQAIERALACSPFACNKYAKELKRVGLEKLDLKLPW
ncbi:unnamed protein product [marine sediment metagenome]|uniref:Uncharacterized protein n=1 Tax=marine sediment metagenome TaxID=412755 RepID=X1TUS5_9ZZZZ